MRRTNLVLGESLLEQARKELGTRTYSSTVNLALAELLRFRHIQHLASFHGSNEWQGELSEMREDRPVQPHARHKLARSRR